MSFWEKNSGRLGCSRIKTRANRPIENCREMALSATINYRSKAATGRRSKSSSSAIFMLKTTIKSFNATSVTFPKALADLDHRKDEFLAMLSHELRNPLAPILNAAELLQRKEGGKIVQQKAQAIIVRQVGQLMHLVDDLMDVSRTITGRIQLRRERIDVSGIVERAVETARPLIDQRRHDLTVSVPPDPIWLHAGSARLEQVVTNLLTNAAKYTNKGGRIGFSVQQEGQKAVLRVR